MRKDISDLMLELSKVDYGEPLPLLDEQFLRVWSEHYRRIIGLIPADRSIVRVLEVGVGYGVLAVLLRRRYSFDLVATEHPSRSYLYAEGFRIYMEREGVRIAEHDLHDPMPFQDQTFDMVFYCDVIEHLAPEVGRFSLGELKRVLKKGGYCVLTTPNFSRLPNRIRLLGGKGINPPVNPRKIGDTFDHIREFTLGEIAEMLRGDFRIVKHEYGLIPFFNEKFNALNSTLFPLFPACGDELYILAQVLHKSENDN